MAEQSSEWEKNRALSISQGGTGKQIGEKRAQMYLAEGGVLKMQYADYPAMPIADLTGRQESAATVPTGAIFMWMASAPPEGYVMCDGTSYTTIEQPRLFGAIGTQFGQTGGAGTFNVPNLSGRVPVGAGSPDYFEDFGGSLSVGAKGGEVSTELTDRHLPEHRHSVDVTVAEHTHTVPSHTHARGTLSVAPHVHELDFVVSDPKEVTYSDLGVRTVSTTTTDLAHDHAVTIDTAGEASLSGSMDGGLSFHTDSKTETNGLDYVQSETVQGTDLPNDDSGSSNHGFTDRYMQFSIISGLGNYGYSSRNYVHSYNTNATQTSDAFNDHIHYVYETMPTHSHSLTDNNVEGSVSFDDNLSVEYTDPVISEGDTTLNHAHTVDGAVTGYQAATGHSSGLGGPVYLNATGATDTPVEADSDDGELTTSLGGASSASGFTGLAGEAILDKVDLKQPYLVVNWIMKT